MNHKIGAVVAIGKNREIGWQDKLLWHIPDDLKRFRSITKGHPIIMGRKTFESIIGYLGKPFPERTSIVVTRDPGYSSGFPEVLVATSIEKAIELAKKQPGAEEIFIGGGEQIYRAALPYMDKLYLTLIDDSKEADTFFPEYEKEFTKKTYEEIRDWNGLTYRWVNLER